MAEFESVKIAPCQYEPLPSQGHIRLLRINPTGAQKPSVYYELITQSLADHPAYHALSYTWGNPLSSPKKVQTLPSERSELVLRDGKAIYVGHNLYNALLRLQQLRFRGNIWIDAVCINQADMNERNTQVSLMGDIYAMAEKVIVWLGEDDYDSQVAFAFLDRFMPKVEQMKKLEENRNPDLSYTFSDPGFFDRLGEPISGEIFDGLANFLERAWFKRVWTFQEVVLARDIQVICGENYIEWVKLEKLLQFLETSEWEMKLSRFQDASKLQQVPGKMILSTMVYRRHVLDGGPYQPGQHEYLKRLSAGYEPLDLLMGELDSLLYSVRCRNATDARDRLYALYGVADRFCKQMNLINPLPAPDYNKSLEKVYTEYCKVILEQSNTLLLLSNVEDRSDENFSLPSWVPDFREDWTIALPRTGSGADYNATKDSKPRLAPSPRAQSLVLDGCYFDTINAIGESDFELGNGKIPFTKCSQMLLDTPLMCPAGQDRAEVFWRTLIADQAQEQYPAPLETANAFYEHMLMHNAMVLLNTESREEALKALQPLCQLATSTSESSRQIPSLPKILQRSTDYAAIRALREQEQSESGITESQIEYGNTILKSTLAKESKALPFSRALSSLFSSKRLVKTSKGYVGTAPQSTRQGDEIYLLKGGRVPFVLRRVSAHAFRLIGDTYVHGIMQGEAFDCGMPAAREVVII